LESRRGHHSFIPRRPLHAKSSGFTCVPNEIAGGRAAFAYRQSTLSCHERQRRLTWVLAKSNHLFTFVKSRAVVEPQNASSDFSDRGQRPDSGLLQKEVFRPTTCARIEEAREFTRRRNRSDVASFAAVAESTSISEIIGFRRSAMLQADDVIDLAAVKVSASATRQYSQRRLARSAIV
jgi:hypothetical protein